MQACPLLLTLKYHLTFMKVTPWLSSEKTRGLL